jgi:YHS domain-containing protein
MIGWVLRFILLMVIIRVIWRFLGGIIDGISGNSSARSQSSQRGRRGGAGPGGAVANGGAASVPLVRDPVCGTYVVRTKALTTGSGDSTQYFCSEKCRDQYRKA